MEEKNQIKISLSTLLLIISIIIIAAMGYIIYNMSMQKIESEQLLASVKEEKKSMESKVVVKEAEVKNVVNTNSTSNNTQEKVSYDSEGIIEVGYNNIVALVNGKPYIIPIYMDGAVYDLSQEARDSYYKKHEVDNISSGVKKVVKAYLGLDPSETTYFLMENGSVRRLSNEVGKKYTSTEEVKASENIVDLVYEDGILYSISKNGEKTKIAESMDR